uniref:MOSC domain-containing protein n=1 Tax=Acrobeloides nanus TaxID=290746 RepID=A0A914CJT1_9BILA
MIDTRVNSYYWIVGTGLTVSAAFLIQHLWKRYLYWNSKFVQAGTVKQLYVHPIKSCKVKEVPWLTVDVRGASYGDIKDRHLIVVDANLGNFLNARQYPKMVLIEADIKDDILTVSVPDRQSISVDLKKIVQNNQIRRATLWFKLKTDGYDCGDEIGNLIAEFLNVQTKRNVRLLYFRDELYTERNLPSDPNYWDNPVPMITDTTAYQDLSAFLLCTQGSVDELNKWLSAENPPTSIEARNFRPNILVEGVEAWDEDRWLDVQIGEAEFVCYKPCTRCILTTVHPDDGKFDSNMATIKEITRTPISS